MKFTDGYWLKRPGVTVYHPKEVRDIQIQKDAITLYIAPWNVVQRGMTLMGPLFTMTITAPQLGILEVETSHFVGGNNNEARFQLDHKHCDLEVQREENLLIIRNERISAEITLDDFKLVYKYDNRYLTSTGFRKLGYAQTPDGEFMMDQLDLSVGEKIYGLGERFTPFVKNGQNVEIWNEDGGTASEQSYKNVPFHLSSNNYGILVDHTQRVSYEIASEVVSRLQFSVEGETLRYCVIGGENRKKVLAGYTLLSGRPALPPVWSFGLWLSTSFTTNYNEETVTSFIDGMAERDIPLHVFHYDCFWMKEYEWCNFQWDQDMFPDVEGMLARLKARGLKICVWINPYIGQKSYLFAEGAKNGYFLKRPDGSVWQWDRWQPGMALIDFTNPEACDWYKSKLNVLLEQGVDCFKTDFGERIPTDVEYFDGSEPVSMHNYYTYLYNEVVFDLLKEVKGEQEAVLFARSATAGGQKFPVHWGGDCDSTFLSMAESLRGGLSLTMSGFGFWSHDISGFESTASPDVYKRWAAFGLLSTHSRLHGSNSYRVPWLFDEESVDVLRHFTNLKCQLVPYLFSSAVETNRAGVPVMRAMALEFEEDNACLELDTQYMLGERILVAPIFREDGIASYYLPKGQWTHLITGEVLEGGSWRNDKFDYFSLPLFVRENTILPMGASKTEADYDFADGLVVQLYALQDKGKANATVCDRNGKDFLNISAVRCGKVVTLELDGSSPELLLVNIDSVENLTGASLVKTEKGVLLKNLESKVQFSL